MGAATVDSWELKSEERQGNETQICWRQQEFELSFVFLQVLLRQ